VGEQCRKEFATRQNSPCERRTTISGWLYFVPRARVCVCVCVCARRVAVGPRGGGGGSQIGSSDRVTLASGAAASNLYKPRRALLMPSFAHPRTIHSILHPIFLSFSALLLDCVSVCTRASCKLLRRCFCEWAGVRMEPQRCVRG